MSSPFISICIPSYERTEYMSRLLDSIEVQTYRNFEVIFTDDSKSEKIKVFLENYKCGFDIHYHKNTLSLGSAKNFLEGKKYAKGDWIKMIHDDDFFADELALELIANACCTGVELIFTGFYNYFEKSGRREDHTLSQDEFVKQSTLPIVFSAFNVFGPPSTLTINRHVAELFDSNLKWFVDIEYYFRVLSKHKATYIPKPLVNFSVNDSQVSSYTQHNPEIVIYETMYIHNKYGIENASNMISYDSWWRTMRNLNIRSESDVMKYAKGCHIPLYIKNIIKHQKYIPVAFLKNGFVSKLAMAFSYFAVSIQQK